MTEVIQDQHPWQGLAALDPEGNKLGKVLDVYLSRADHHPVWMVVGEGLFGLRRVFVPVVGARSGPEGVHAAFSADTVSSAPRPADDGLLQPDEEVALWRHYGFEPQPTPHADAVAAGAAGAAGAASTAAFAAAGVDPDGAMIRSEEELVVDKATRPAERVRLVKHVEVEHREITVPVLREELRIERIPAAAALDLPPSAPSGSWPTESPQALIADQVVDVGEIVLYAEEVVVTKRLVPRERVRLTKDVVTDTREVRAEVRKERIETEEEPIR